MRHVIVRPIAAAALAVALAASSVAPLAAQTAAQRAAASRTRIVMLGTGTPIPDPDRGGAAVAVVVDSVAYLFDAGTGVVRAAARAGRAGVRAFAAATPGAQPDPRFARVFLTHLHADHTLGLADAILTPWIQGRAAPLDVHGPPGTARLVRGLLDAYAEDVAERAASPGGPSRDGWRAVAHEIADGAVYRDALVTVRAFAVPHSDWPHALGYRIETPDRTIVISGDTRASDAVVAACDGCDVLIHEVYSDAGFATIPAARQAYHAHAHTSAAELGALATRARPALLVLYHQLHFGASDATLLGEVRARFRGAVASARDGDVY